MDKIQIKYHLNEHLLFYRQHYPNRFVGIFLQGSQNYNLDTETSDVDSKIIIVPTFQDIISNKRPISATLTLPNNEHCDVKDIRLMFDDFKKQNINFLEILFTEYKIMNADYYELFQPMFLNREEIARYDNYAGLKTMVGTISNRHKMLTKSRSSVAEIIEKYGYDGKSLCHMWRILDFIQLFFVRECSFADSMVVKEGKHRDDYMNAKLQKFSKSFAVDIAQEIERVAFETERRYLDTHEHVINRDVDVVMNDVLMAIIRKTMMDEFN